MQELKRSGIQLPACPTGNYDVNNEATSLLIASPKALTSQKKYVNNQLTSETISLWASFAAGGRIALGRCCKSKYGCDRNDRSSQVSQPLYYLVRTPITKSIKQDLRPKIPLRCWRLFCVVYSSVQSHSFAVCD